MEIIGYAAMAYLLVQLIVALANLLTRQLLPAANQSSLAFISILIPARNEALNIGNLLDDLSCVDHPEIEILVYDDDSNDQTAEIVQGQATRFKNMRYIKGQKLLPGWLGKNYACHQLARQAKGDFLLFLDADVRVGKGIIRDALAYMTRHRLALLSLFPVQTMKTLGEWLTVPLMNRILLGNLPLIMIRKTKLPDFAAANGQFMLFDARIYKRYWFHKLVNDERVEDIRIMRMIKRYGFRGATLLSDGQITCRMYTNYGEGLNGFAKNIHAFFGKNWLILGIYVSLTTLGPLAVWLAFPVAFFIIYIGILILYRILLSAQSRQSWWRNALLMPFQQFSLMMIATLAAYRHVSGSLVWKGRKI